MIRPPIETMRHKSETNGHSSSLAVCLAWALAQTIDPRRSRNMSIVVTGATGHLGRLVIDELLARVPADQVVAVVRDAEKAADFAARGVELRVAD
ncbi:MAG: NAD(P)H-binding protein, partial [Nocardioidaceae bacterium]